MIQLPSANALDVDRLVRAELERLSKTFPPGIKYAVAFNTTEVVDESIREVRKTLFEAIALVVLVMFVFLQSWRSTLIPTITIPVSLVGAFAFAKLMGFSINTLTLFGIILATGIVVDDAIVVIENIERHIQEEHKPAHEAASDAMREVFGAVIATALVLIAVFVPVAFFPGTTGRLYSQFSITIAFSVALSAFNALTLTPALSALLLDRAHHGKGRFFTGVERVISAGTTRLRRRAPRRDAAAVGRGPALRAGGSGRPCGSTGPCRARSCPRRTPATSSPWSRRRPARRSSTPRTSTRQAEAILKKDPDIESSFAVMGFSFSGAAPNQGLIFAAMKPFAERHGEEHSVKATLARIFGPLLGRSAAAIVVPFAPPSIQGLGPVRRLRVPGPRPVRAATSTRWSAATYGMVGAGNASPMLAGLFSSFTTNDPQLNVEIDRERALALGVPLSEITSALQIFLGSAVRQRLRLQQPRVSRLRAGGQARSAPSPDVARQALRAHADRPDGAARERGQGQGSDGAAGHQPLQPVPLRDDQRIGPAGLQLGPGADRRWSASPSGRCRPA